jgi:hypothetical protein
VVTLEDDAYLIPDDLARRRSFAAEQLRGFVVGEIIRDWDFATTMLAIFPHAPGDFGAVITHEVFRWLWPLRMDLSNRLWFKKTQIERGYEWYAYGHISIEKFRTPLTISFAFVATHNHFVLDRAGKIFGRTAPVIKLPAHANDDDYLGLLGLLNSSTACFWIKQICMDRGGGGIGGGLATEGWERFYEHDGGKIEQFPLVDRRPLDLACQLDILAHQLTDSLPAALTPRSCCNGSHHPAAGAWSANQRPE